jgi:hypothetical protein
MQLEFVEQKIGEKGALQRAFQRLHRSHSESLNIKLCMCGMRTMYMVHVHGVRQRRKTEEKTLLGSFKPNNILSSNIRIYSSSGQ